MADVNANIDINIDSSNAVANLRRLELAINDYQRNIASANTAAANSSAALNRALVDGINNTGMFSAKIAPATDSVGRFTTALEKNKLSLGEYTKYAASQLPGLSRVFRREFDTMQQVAESRVKKMQTQYLALGQTVDGTARSISMMPRGLAPGYATDVALATQRHQMFNKMIDDGSTKLLNWGKNTQWAGRQLMVGFSIPLAALGVTASKTFMEIDKATTSLKRVYGDLSTTSEEVNKNIAAINALGKEYTKYGIALSDTVNVAATAAAAGMKNEQLTANTKESLRLATLGQIDYQQALTTTITLQNAFGTSNKELAPTVDFIGAVANQTVLSVDDLTNAIPRVAPVIKGLGGNVKDLAVLLVAMREGGVSAEQGANALKSGLANLINPTKAASKAAAQYKIDLQGIVNANKGDIMGTIKSLATALSSLDEFSRQQVLEKIFGKYQFARIGALFDHINEKTGQVKQAMDLLGMSTEDLAKVSDKSLSAISESTTVKFQAALEQLKISIAPLGQAFLKGITPIVNMVSKVADAFNNLPDGVKNAAAVIIAAVAGIGPILLMTVGLLANGFANIIKVIQVFRKGLAGIRGDGDSFRYLSTAELEAAAATDALEGSVQSLTGKLLLQKGAVSSLTQEYLRFIDVAGIASAVDGLGGFGGIAGGMPTRGAAATRGASKAAMRMATGGIVPGTGNGDTIPALLTPGESVITKKATQKYAPILQQMNDGTLPGFAAGGVGLISATRRLLNPKDLNWKYFVSDRSAPQTMKANAASITGGYTDELFKDILGLGLGRKPNDQEFKKLFERLYYSGKNGEKIKSGFGAAMSIAHIENLGRNRLGYKQWDYENTRLTSGLENSALNDLFKSTRSKNFFLSKIQDLSLTKEDQQILTRIIKNGRHPSSIKEYKLLENLLVSSRKSKDFQNLYRKNSNNYLYTDFLIGVSRARRAETSAAKTLIKKHGEDPYALFTGEPLTFGQTVEKKTKGYSLGEVSIGEALKTWQTSARQVRENPEALAAIMGGMQQSSTSRTLHRSTTLGLGRGSEFSPQESAILFEALRSGNVGSLVGREFSINSPVSYTAGGLGGTLGALAQNTDVNRINSLINQLYQRKNRRIDDLKMLARARKNLAAGIMPELNQKIIQELEQKTEKTKYLAEQKRLQQQIKELAPRGYQNVVFEQRFPKGSPLLDVNAATGGAGTYMGKNVAHEQEFISPGSRVKVVDVQVDPKTGLTKIITEALPSSFSANPKIPMSRQEQIAAIEKRSIAAAERYDGLKEQSLGSILKLKFNDRREASSPSEFLSGMFNRWESVPTRPSPKEDMQLTMKSGKLKYPAIPQDEYLADMIMNSAKFKDYAPDTFKPIKVGKIQNIGDTERIFDGHTRVHAKTVEGIIRNILGKNPENMSKQELIDAINEVKVMSERGLLTNKQILSATKGQTLLTTQAGIDEIDRMTLRSRTQQPMQSMYNSGGRILIEGIHDREIEQILAAGRDAGFRGIGNDSLSLMKAMGFVRPTMGDNNWYRYDPNFLYRENGSYVTNTARKILNGLIDRKMILPLRRNSGGPIPGVGTQDTVPALLTPGEFVVNKDAAAQHSSLLHSINGNNTAQSYAGVQHFASGGFVRSAMKKAEDLSLYLNARHGSRGSRGWEDPLSIKGISQTANGTMLGPGAYLTTNTGEARSYANMMDSKAKMGQDGAGYIYRQSRNPKALLKFLLGKGYLRYEDVAKILREKGYGNHVHNEFEAPGAEQYEILRKLKYQGIAKIEPNGFITVVDFASSTNKYNKMVLANSKNPFGAKQARIDKQTIKQNEILNKNITQDEGFFLNDGAVMLGHGMVPGVGNKDTIPAMLTPGESVITKEATRKYAPILSQMNRGTLQGFEGGVVDSQSGREGASGRKDSWKETLAKLDKEDPALANSMRKRIAEEMYVQKAMLEAGYNKSGSLSDYPVAGGHITQEPGVKNFKDIRFAPPQAQGMNNLLQTLSNFGKTGADLTAAQTKREILRDALAKKQYALDSERLHGQNEANIIMEKLEKGTRLNYAETQRLAEANREILKNSEAISRSSLSSGSKDSMQRFIRQFNAGAEAQKYYKENVKQNPSLRTESYRAWEEHTRNMITKSTTRPSMPKVSQLSPVAQQLLEKHPNLGPVEAERMARTMINSEKKAAMSEWKRTPSTAPKPNASQAESKVLKTINSVPPSKESIEERRAKVQQSRNERIARIELENETKKVLKKNPTMNPEEAKNIARTNMEARATQTSRTRGQRFSSFARGVAGPLAGALGAASMAPMFMRDEQGKFMGMDANAAMMGLIGGSSVLGMVGVLPPTIAGPVLGIAAALAAVAIPIWKLQDEFNKTTHAVSDFNNKMYGAAGSVENMAKELGRQTNAQKSASFAGMKVSKISDQQTLQFGQQFTQTTSGKQMVQDMKDLAIQGGNVAQAMTNQLTHMILSGVVNPEEAQAIALQMESELNKTGLSVKVNANIDKIIGYDGLNLKNNVVGIVGKISPVIDPKQLDKQVDSMYKQRSSFAGGGFGQFMSGLGVALAGEAQTKNAMKMEAYANAIGQAVSLERDARAQINLELQQGLITLEKYKTLMDDLNSNGPAQQSFKAATEMYSKNVEGRKNVPTSGVSKFGAVGVAAQNRTDAALLNKNINDNFNLFASQTSMADEVKNKINDIANSLQEASQTDPFAGSQFITDVMSGKINQNVLQQLFYFPKDQITKIAGTTQEMEKLSSTLEPLSQYPDLTQKLIQFKIDHPDEFNKEADKITKQVEAINAIPDVVQKSFNLDVNTMNDSQLDYWSKQAPKINEYKGLLEKLNPNIDMKSFVQRNILDKSGKDQLSVEEMTNKIIKLNKAYDNLAGSNKSLNKKAIIDIVTEENGKEVAGGVSDYISKNIKDFNKFKLEDKTAIITIITNMVELQNGLSTTGAGPAPSRLGGIAAIENGAKALADTKEKERLAVANARINSGGGGGSGGGSKQLTAYEQYKKDTEGQSRLLPGLKNQLIKKLKSAGMKSIPEEIWNVIGTGAQGEENIRSFLSAKSKDLVATINKATNNVFNTTIDNLATRTKDAKKKTEAINKLKLGGFSEKEQQFIVNDDALMLQAQNLTVGSDKWNIFAAKVRAAINAEKDAADAMMTTDEKIQQQRDELQKNMEIVKNAISQEKMRLTNENAEKFLATNGMTTDEMHHQIDANNRIIEQEQDKINAKQRQIDDLSRQDELNNRISNALSHDLDIMSQQEQKIRETYQKRIDALNKVAEINDHIAQQQQTQIGLAKALSEGDVYAAAQAAQQMQQDQIQYAQKQQQDALQTGMQNAVDNLRTPSGLTRKQAEQQVNAIKEQSYQINLRIRDIQDEIYTIQNGQMRTLQDQNESYSRKLEYNQQDLEWQIATNQFQGHSIAYWEKYMSDLDIATLSTIGLADAINKLNAEFDKYLNKSGSSTAPTGATSSSGLPQQASNGQSFSDMTGTDIGNLTGSDIGNYLQWAHGININNPGGSAFAMATGGMVPRYYASGGHVNMDSVPAMLTPGEFVMRKAAVKKYGIGNLSDMNMGRWDLPTYNTKKLYAPSNNVSAPSRGNMQNNISAPVYNTYSINVPVNQPGASADEIASKVMMKIKNIENSSIRRIGGY